MRGCERGIGRASRLRHTDTNAFVIKLKHSQREQERLHTRGGTVVLSTSCTCREGRGGTAHARTHSPSSRLAARALFQAWPCCTLNKLDQQTRLHETQK